MASGDSGSPSCDQNGDSVGWPYSAQYGLSVSGLASTPYNVAVGGTDFSWCKPVVTAINNNTGVVTTTGCPASSTSQGSPAYWAASNNTSTEPYESALGYVPEIPWNNTCLNPLLANYLSSFLSVEGYSGGSNPEATCNAIQNNWYSLANHEGWVLAFYIDTIGGSGGASNCVVNDGSNTSSCTTSAGSSTTGSSYGNIPIYNDGWVKPSWQVAAESTVGVPNDGVRDLPDVSFFAGRRLLEQRLRRLRLGQRRLHLPRQHRRNLRGVRRYVFRLADHGRRHGSHQPEGRISPGPSPHRAVHAGRRANLLRVQRRGSARQYLLLPLDRRGHQRHALRQGRIHRRHLLQQRLVPRERVRWHQFPQLHRPQQRRHGRHAHQYQCRHLRKSQRRGL